MTFRRKPAQTFTPGAIVTIGFVRGLEVIKRVPTPGDGRPDCWALQSVSTGKFYQFQPHLGLRACADLRAALAA